MVMNENGPINEVLWEQRESQEQLASQKFDEVFNKIRFRDSDGAPVAWEKEHYNVSFSTADGMGISLNAIVDEAGTRILEIIKNVEYDERNNLVKQTQYSVRRMKSDIHPYLRVGESNLLTRSSSLSGDMELSPQELLDVVLPNFEKRLRENESYRKQELEKRNEYAHVQDQKNAEDMMDEFLAA